MKILNPVAVIFAGAPCTGKTTVAKGLCKLIANSFILEKDYISNSFLHMKEVDEGGYSQIVSTKEYLKTCYGPEVLNKTKEGLMSSSIFSLPWGSPYYARHVRDQTYQAMIDIANLNLKLGKVPILASIASTHFSERYHNFVYKLLNSFGEYKTAMIYMHLPEEVIRQRMIEAMKFDPKRIGRDGAKVKNDESWKKELKKNPVFPSNLEDFEHLKINALESPKKCAQKAFDYVHSIAKQ